MIRVGGGGGGGYRSRFTENKKALSQFRKKYIIDISRFTENKREHFGKSRFTTSMEITIHEKWADHGS